MLKFFREQRPSAGLTLNYSQTLDATAADYLDKKIWNEVVDRLATEWVDKYRVQVLKELSPKQVKEAVTKQIEDTFAKRFL